jgi:hypothetical protein
VQMQAFVDQASLSPSQILSDLSALASTHAIHFELPSKNRALAWRILQPAPLASATLEEQLDRLASDLYARLCTQVSVSFSPSPRLLPILPDGMN